MSSLDHDVEFFLGVGMMVAEKELVDDLDAGTGNVLHELIRIPEGCQHNTFPSGPSRRLFGPPALQFPKCNRFRSKLKAGGPGSQRANLFVEPCEPGLDEMTACQEDGIGPREGAGRLAESSAGQEGITQERARCIAHDQIEIAGKSEMLEAVVEEKDPIRMGMQPFDETARHPASLSHCNRDPAKIPSQHAGLVSGFGRRREQFAAVRYEPVL